MDPRSRLALAPPFRRATPLTSHTPARHCVRDPDVLHSLRILTTSACPLTEVPQKATTLRWALVWTALLAVLVVPFLAFGEVMKEADIYQLGTTSPSTLRVALLVIVLHAVDVILPLPSSVISTAAGYFMGVAAGTVVSAVGMTLGAILGYVIGAFGGSAAVQRFVGMESFRRTQTLVDRRGVAAVVLVRALPVLAEASTLSAGMYRMPFGRFFVSVALANVGISLVYAVAGARAATTGSFLIAFAAAIALPLAYFGVKRLRELLATKS